MQSRLEMVSLSCLITISLEQVWLSPGRAKNAIARQPKKRLNSLEPTLTLGHLLCKVLG